MSDTNTNLCVTALIILTLAGCLIGAVTCFPGCMTKPAVEAGHVEDSPTATSKIGVSEVGVIIILLIFVYTAFRAKRFVRKTVGPVVHAENTKQLNAWAEVNGDETRGKKVPGS